MLEDVNESPPCVRSSRSVAADTQICVMLVLSPCPVGDLFGLESRLYD